MFSERKNKTDKTVFFSLLVPVEECYFIFRYFRCLYLLNTHVVLFYVQIFGLSYD